MAKKTHQFNVLLSPAEFQKVTELADLYDVSASEIVRQSIRWRHMMVFQKTPLCVNGNQCFVPQMHIKPTPAPAPQPATETPGG